MSLVITDPTIIDDFLDRRIDTLIPNKEELRKRLLSGDRLRLYQGFDPTSPNLHIGHLVGLLTLKTFQNLGHEVIFLLGDGTGQAGDPTGKAKDRGTFFTKEQLKANTREYKSQASAVLNFEGDNPVKILFNSEWLNKLQLLDILNIADTFTVQQILERDMYQERLKSNESINLREFLYPLLQGYDSVAMEVDLELGGSDQLFNMIAGRKLVKDFLNKEKLVATTPLLADSSGKKIGKTEGNAINIANPPEQLYGQMMSLPDDAILPCFKLITLVPSSLLPSIEQQVKTDPMTQKKRLAWELIKLLHNEEKAGLAQFHFEKTVQQHEIPEDIPSYLPRPGENVVDIMKGAGLASSKSEARRLIDQGGVSVNEEKITELTAKLEPNSILKIGKRKYLKITE